MGKIALLLVHNLSLLINELLVPAESIKQVKAQQPQSRKRKLKVKSSSWVWFGRTNPILPQFRHFGQLDIQLSVSRLIFISKFSLLPLVFSAIR